MSCVTINTNKLLGKIRPMNCVNNGPVGLAEDPGRGNFQTYKKLKIPFARTHDSNFFSGYGGPHTVDVGVIFPDFSKDVKDPDAYDFQLTDEYIQKIIAAGTEPFYRLGASIEHWSKKYHTLPPKDNQKWAEVCEHIIRHYTEGWANGFTHKIRYWEIWNEPDLDAEDSVNKKCWGGTKLQFFEFYKTVALHLKKCFPHLKIGGPALAWDKAWLDDFLKMMSGDGDEEKRVPIDFISWHRYMRNPWDVQEDADIVEAIMKKYGYEAAESHLNEWNYVRGWATEAFNYSIETIIGMKGAAFTLAAMIVGQNVNKLDMMMYYDARPTGMNGIWDLYLYRPLKTYYSFEAYNKLAEYGTQLEVASDDKDIYALSACSADGKVCTVFSHFVEEDTNAQPKTVRISIDSVNSNPVSYLLDEANNLAEVPLLTKCGENTYELTLAPNTVAMVDFI